MNSVGFFNSNNKKRSFNDSESKKADKKHSLPFLFPITRSRTANGGMPIRQPQTQELVAQPRSRAPAA